MRKYFPIVLAQVIVTLCLCVALVTAQVTCDVDVSDVINQVEDVCTQVGENQVCYGNFEVSAIVQDNTPALNFSMQGDLADVENIRSLYLSGLDPEQDRWGIAQMRLLTTTTNGTQDVNLLLFGDVEIENTVEQAPKFDVVVGQYSANVRNFPRDNSLILESVPAGETIEAVGRVDDTSWIRVRLENGAVGWVASFLINPTNDDDNFADLSVQDSASPYFGAMQAFYFTEGDASQCGNVMSDGLLIQTPQGTARVTLLINEVSIELIPNQNGATALVTGSASNGMTISVIDGTAYVESNGSSFFVDSTQQTTIELDANLQPIGTPSIPITYNVDDIAVIPVLGIIRDNTIPIIPSAATTNNGSGSNNDTTANNDVGNNRNNENRNNGNRNGNGNGNGNANGNSNGGNGNGNGNANGN